MLRARRVRTITIADHRMNIRQPTGLHGWKTSPSSEETLEDRLPLRACTGGRFRQRNARAGRKDRWRWTRFLIEKSLYAVVSGGIRLAGKLTVNQAEARHKGKIRKV